MLREFLELFEKYGENPPIRELWKRLPALRTISILGREYFAGAEREYAATQVNFERIFSGYIRHELFSFELNHTDDFQKFDGTKPVGTDYVSFNTTACLARAIIGRSERKNSPPFFVNGLPHTSALFRNKSQQVACRVPNDFHIFTKLSVVRSPRPTRK